MRSNARPAFLAGLLAIGCGGTAPSANRAALLDSTNCRTCHPSHFDEWAGSMHAYASDDPVFVAMNRRGQRETSGALGNFCVNCHAPMAVREGLTRDGLNLATLPAAVKGVTCVFCHTIESVDGAHNNPMTLARDGAMLGPIADPAPNAFHTSRYSSFLDSSRTEAANACGSCHDIVNGKGTAIERTFAEWQDSVFARIKGGLGCAACHMNGRQGLSAINPDRPRRVHDHRMAGLDVALTPWPDTEGQRKAIDETLSTAIQTAVCLDDRNNRIQVLLDNVGVGHMWPSGAGADRRAWVEVVATAKGEVVYQSGVVPTGGSIDQLDDPDLWLIRDCLHDESGKEVHMFWEAAQFSTNLLPATRMLSPQTGLPQRGHLRWDLPTATSGKTIAVVPDRIRARVMVQPIASEVLNELVASGDLEAGVAARMPTFEVPNSTVEWAPDRVNFQLQERGSSSLCVAPPGFSQGSIAAASQRRCAPPGK